MVSELISNSCFMHHPTSPFPLSSHSVFSKRVTLFRFVVQFKCSGFYIASISDILGSVSFSVWLISLGIVVPKSTHHAATSLMTLISWLSYIPLYMRTPTSLSIFLFPGYLRCNEVGVLVNRAALNFGVPVSCWFLVFPIYTPMSGSALCTLSCVFRCFRTHRTLLQSGCWQFTSRPSA